KGKPIPNVANAITALEHDAEICDALGYDEMLHAPVLIHQPGIPFDGDVSEPRPLTDEFELLDFPNVHGSRRFSEVDATRRSRADSAPHRARRRRFLRPAPVIPSGARISQQLAMGSPGTCRLMVGQVAGRRET